MLEKVIGFNRQHGLIKKGDFVIVGVSGGADSVALLHILLKLKEEIGYSMIAVHIHHGLRGMEADADAEFVRDFCRDFKIDSIQVDINLKELAAEEGIGVEEAGRKYRYEIFEQIKKEYLRELSNFPLFSYKNIEERWKEKNKDFNICLWENSTRKNTLEDFELPAQQSKHRVKIALAHHKNDQAETILFHLIRGSGLRGCSGIHPKREDIIRPILHVSRAEIEEYLRKENLSYCTDSTNHSNVYARNILRNEIVPLMTTKINPMAVDNIVRAGGMFLEADEYFFNMAKKILKEHLKEDVNGVRIRAEVLKGNPSILRKYMIRQMIMKLLELHGLGFRDIHYGHIADAEGLLYARTSTQIDLPYGIVAKKEYIDIIVYLRKDNPCHSDLGSFSSRVFPYSVNMEIPRSGDIRWFDYEKLKEPLMLRHREVGDYLYLLGVGRKTLKSYMIDKKINQELRDELPVLACDHHIIWLIGYRTSDAFRVDEHTKWILEVKYAKERENELSY